jgi:predicted nucleic acid-binding protein
VSGPVDDAPHPGPAPLTLDAGALIAFERADRRLVALLQRGLARGAALAVPAGVVGQVWRDGARQARLARLLRSSSVEVVPLDDQAARAAGQLCGVAGTRDVIDASVVLCARARGGAVVSSDPGDLRHLDPSLLLIRV